MNSAQLIDFTPARESIFEAHLGLRFSGSLTDPYRLRYVPAATTKGVRIPGAFATACWMWREDESDPHHVITFGEALADRLVGPTDERLGAYGVSYYRHEVAHSLYTERNLKALSEAAERVGVPFSLINLLEDARIEHLERKNSGRAFAWTEFEGKNTGSTPDGYFLAIIQADGVVADALYAEGATLSEAQAGRVRDYYYPSAIQCPSSWAILKLAQEWVKEFGAPSGSAAGDGGAGAGGASGAEGGAPGGDTGKGAGSSSPSGAGGKKGKKAGGKAPGTEGRLNADMVAALEAMLNAAVAEAILSAEEIGGSETDADSKAFGMGQKESIQVDEFTTGNLLDGATDLNVPLAERLFAQARSAFPRTQARVTTMSPSKRLHMRNVIRDLDRVYRKLVDGDTVTPPEIVFMLDCSGSMNAGSGYEKLSTHDLGCTVLAALSRMAEQGLVRGHAVLTCGRGRKAVCQTLPLPVSDAQIARIYSSGQFEGFDSAMRVCDSLLRRASLVLAYTDGHITDRPIDRTFWHRHGVYSVGLYCGDARISKSLTEWFDAALSRETPEGLMDALAQTLRKWSHTRAAA